MKSLFGFANKLEPVKPDEEDVVLRAFHSLVAGRTPQAGDPGEGSDEQEAEARVPPGPGNDGEAARVDTQTEPEGSERKAGAGASLPAQEPVPLAALSVSRDDAILVRGTLVTISSDSDSDDGGQEPEEGSTTNGPKPPSVALSEPSEEPQEKPGDCRELVATRERDADQLGARGPPGAPPETGSQPGPGDGGLHAEHSPGQGHAGGEEGAQAPAVGTDQSLSVAVAENTSSKKDAPGEKFQLPAFFSGLRVLKKGAPAEGGETITEIKPKDGDLALLKLTQPVQKSLAQAGPQTGPQTGKTGDKTSDLKATPTLLEQLSQLLSIDMPRAEPRAEDPEPPRGGEMGCSGAQESQGGPGEAQTQGGEVKPKPQIGRALV